MVALVFFNLCVVVYIYPNIKQIMRIMISRDPEGREKCCDKISDVLILSTETRWSHLSSAGMNIFLSLHEVANAGVELKLLRTVAVQEHLHQNLWLIIQKEKNDLRYYHDGSGWWWCRVKLIRWEIRSYGDELSGAREQLKNAKKVVWFDLVMIVRCKKNCLDQHQPSESHPGKAHQSSLNTRPDRSDNPSKWSQALWSRAASQKGSACFDRHRQSYSTRPPSRITTMSNSPSPSVDRSTNSTPHIRRSPPELQQQQHQPMYPQSYDQRHHHYTQRGQPISHPPYSYPPQPYEQRYEHHHPHSQHQDPRSQYHAQPYFSVPIMAHPPPPPPQMRDNYGRQYPPINQPPVTIVHTDDAATKLTDGIRRRCFNCCTTDTSTWRRSNLSPGKVVRLLFLRLSNFWKT